MGQTFEHLNFANTMALATFGTCFAGFGCGVAAISAQTLVGQLKLPRQCSKQLMIVGDYTAIQHTSGDYHLVYVNGFLEPFFSGIISSQALAKESAANMRQPIGPQSESPENCKMQLWATQCDSHRS